MYCAEAKARTPAFEQRTADEIALLGLTRPDRHVGGAHADVDLIVVEDQLDADFRIELAELFQPWRQPYSAEANRRRNAEITGRLCRRIGQQRFCRLQLGEDVR